MNFKPLDVVKDKKGRILVIYNVNSEDDDYSCGILTDKWNEWTNCKLSDFVELIDLNHLSEKQIELYVKYKTELVSERQMGIASLDIYKIKKGIILTQEEMIEKYYNLINTHGDYYKKFQLTYARKGIVGERIDTIVESGLETSVIVKENQIVILAQTNAKEQYVVNEEKFYGRYDEIKIPVPDELKEKGFKNYQSKGEIKTILASNIMEEGVDEIFFIASWGEQMRCQATDHLAIPLGLKPEIYRIAVSEFKQTYR